MRWMRILVPLLALLLVVPAVPRSDVKKSFNFFVGMKQIDDLSEDDFGAELDSHADVGLEMSFGAYDWPVMMAVDFLVSGTDDSYDYSYDVGIYTYDYNFDFKAATAEFDVGIRKTWEFANNPTRPYIGIGVGAIHGRLEFELDTDFGSLSEEDSQTAFGFWIGGGVYWKLGRTFNLGLNVRHSTAEIDLELPDFLVEAEGIEVGGTHAGLILGWGF